LPVFVLHIVAPDRALGIRTERQSALMSTDIEPGRS